MILLELLGATLLTATGAWPLLRFLASARVRRRRQRQGILLFASAFNTVTFIAAFLFLSVCAERLAPTESRPEPASPAPIAALPSNLPPAPVSDERERQRQDLYRGYNAGYALATDPQHQGSKAPNSWVLDALANIRGKGRSPSFLDGFKRGYVAGLKSNPGPGSARP